MDAFHRLSRFGRAAKECALPVWKSAASVPGDRPQREALAFEPGHVPDRPLHLGDRHQGAVLAEPVADGQDAAQVAPRVLSCSASATADRMVKISLDTPLPVVPPPRSIMCSGTPPDLSRPNTS